MGACLSALSSSFILLLAVFRSFPRTKRRLDACDNSIFLNLMVADLIQAFAELPILKWMSDGVVTEGPLCTAQAVGRLVSVNGALLSSLAIAVYTFCVLILRWRIQSYVSKLVVLVIWIFIALLIAISSIIHMKERIYGSVGYTCWIRTEFRILQLVTGHMWTWASLCLTITLYIVMFVVMRGWLIVDNGVWHWYKPRDDGAGQPDEETQEERDSKAIANLLLLYPAAYLLYMTPFFIIRWLAFTGIKIRLEYQINLFSRTLFSLSGVFNTVLFFLTRPHLIIGPADPPAPTPAVDIQTQSLKGPSSENFGSLPTHCPNCNCVPPVALGASTKTCSSPRRVESNLGNYVSGERRYKDFSPVPVLAPVQE
jgi:hypothetical protein